MKDKIILIVGCGTFANAMIKKLLTSDVREIRIFNRSEKNQWESRSNYKDDRIKYIIGDIRDYDAIYTALENVDICMSAGAMKHIDKCEAYPDECRKTNIDGNINVINAAITQGVSKVLFTSTDKSANPTTIYGCSKLFLEMYIQCIDSKNTKIITTRYGNVLGSNGSVVQIFKKLAKDGKPLTITDPNMTRFFMSINQAIDLVLYALENGKDKDLWVYNNKSCTIKELANCFSDNQIVTGLRCEEKNDEALLTLQELKHSKVINNYFCVNKTNPINTKYTQSLTSENAERLTHDELIDLINECE